MHSLIRKLSAGCLILALTTPVLAQSPGAAVPAVRAVMMTSIAFILGLAPLVWANGASMMARQNVSAPVFVGMIAASTIGIILIPMLYVTFQSVWEAQGAAVEK